MADVAVKDLPVHRAAVAIAVTTKGGDGSAHAPDAKWELKDVFVLSVDRAALSSMDSAGLVRAFLSGVCEDRVQLHKSLEAGFETAVTLADPEAFDAIVKHTRTHFTALEGTANDMVGLLNSKKSSDAASGIANVNMLENDLLEARLKLCIARQRVAAKQYVDDAELKGEISTLQGRVNQVQEDINAALGELRAELSDLES